MPLFTIVNRTPDPRELEEARQRGVRDAIRELSRGMDTGAHPLSVDASLTDPWAVGYALRDQVGFYIEQHLQDEARIEKGRVQRDQLRAQLETLEHSQSVEHLAVLEQKVAELEQKLATAQRERTQARQLYDRECQETRRLAQALVQTNEELMRAKNPGEKSGEKTTHRSPHGEICP